MSLLLSQAEIREVTDRTHVDAQLRVLEALGIPAKVDGRRVVVLRSALEVALGGKLQLAHSADQSYDVDVDALRRLPTRAKETHPA